MWVAAVVIMIGLLCAFCVIIEPLPIVRLKVNNAVPVGTEHRKILRKARESGWKIVADIDQMKDSGTNSMLVDVGSFRTIIFGAYGRLVVFPTQTIRAVISLNNELKVSKIEFQKRINFP